MVDEFVKTIDIQVAYGTKEQQHIIDVCVPENTTIQTAIEASSICELCPEIDLSVNKVGIFGCVLPLSHTLLSGDRVEIYRNLKIDPKKARRMRKHTL